METLELNIIPNANKEVEFICAMAQVMDRYKPLLNAEQMSKSVEWAGKDYSFNRK
jgi:hypothetical protein